MYEGNGELEKLVRLSRGLHRACGLIAGRDAGI